MTDFRVFVTGSRDWPHPSKVWSALDDAAVDAEAYMAEAMVIVHGGAHGADYFARCWCERNRVTQGKFREPIPVIEEIHRPHWNGPSGKGAGFARNERMAKRSIDLCLAFIKDDSRGATHALGCAEKAGVLARVWRV